MRIRKYDFNYARRHFLEQSAKGIFAAGVFGTVWDAVAGNGGFENAYPDELLSIEMYTKGKLKPGDTIDASNVDIVADLLDPIRLIQVKQMGRKIKLVPTTTEMTKLSPPDYIEATLRNQGLAQFDAKGNVVTKEGKPWIGGNPFPKPQSAVEVFVPVTLSWGRHDISFYAIRDYELDADGVLGYTYEVAWVEYAAVGRTTVDPKPYLTGAEDKLRYNTVFFTYPQDAKGTSFLNIWPYDQTQFPDLMGYLPQFKRVRRFPSSQRFEPLIPGTTLYLSDAWAAGDPMLTWGNFRIIHRGPFLASSSRQWHPEYDNWEPRTVGGGKDSTYYYVTKELVPEVIVFEGEPTGYPRAPVSKRRIYIDTRNMGPVMAVSYDRRGEAWKGFEGGGGQRIAGERRELVKDGRPEWSWNWAISHDVQTNKVTRFHQAEQCRGNWKTALDPDIDMVNQYMTTAAMLRLGT